VLPITVRDWVIQKVFNPVTEASTTFAYFQMARNVRVGIFSLVVADESSVIVRYRDTTWRVGEIRQSVFLLMAPPAMSMNIFEAIVNLETDTPP